MIGALAPLEVRTTSNFASAASWTSTTRSSGRCSCTQIARRQHSSPPAWRQGSDGRTLPRSACSQRSPPVRIVVLRTPSRRMRRCDRCTVAALIARARAGRPDRRSVLACVGRLRWTVAISSRSGLEYPLGRQEICLPGVSRTMAVDEGRHRRCRTRVDRASRPAATRSRLARRSRRLPPAAP